MRRSYNIMYLPHYIENGVDYGEGIEINGIIWAPVNVGYDATKTPYGMYYQFGRYAGSGYYTTSGGSILSKKDGNCMSLSSAAVPTGKRTTPNANYYYKAEDDWYTTTAANRFTQWPLKEGDIEYNKNYLDNPCPKGWRPPTGEELLNLLGGNMFTNFYTGTHGTTTDLKGRYFNGTDDNAQNGVFLPAGAYLQNNGSGTSYSRGNSLDYWACDTASNGNPYFLRFAKNDEKTMGPHVVSTGVRAYGFQIRAVYDPLYL